MRNLLTVTALLISATGIFVSLAREELRCQFGLQSAECAGRVENRQPSSATAPESTPAFQKTKANRHPAQALIEKLPTAEPVRNVITPDQSEATQGQKTLQKPSQAVPQDRPLLREETPPIAPPAQEKMTPEPGQETATKPSETTSETPGQAAVEPSAQPSAPAIAPDGQPIPVIPPETQTSQ